MKKLKDYVNDVLNLVQTTRLSETAACRKIAEEHGLNPDSLRWQWKEFKKDNKDHKALSDESTIMGFPLDNVSSYWLKSKHISVHVKGNKEGNDSILDSIREIVSEYNPDALRTIEQIHIDTPKAIKATLSDMHIGLNPNPDNKSLFSYEYNEAIFKQSIDKVFNSLLKEYNHNGRFDLLIIDDLGDGLDGWNGLTTRGGHRLEQNMTNEDCFRVFIEGKLTLIENCIKAGIANKIIVRNVANDNHSGSFASIANMAIQMILNRTYSDSDVSFYILERFMEHFKYGDHTFILTHGKDSKYMFKGLPYELNPSAINFINDYINHYDIDSKFIHLEKGDLHRVGYSRAKNFDYRNYMSFAPPSSWVQHNFGDCYAGYSIQIIPKYSGEVSHSDYYFDLVKKTNV